MEQQEISVSATAPTEPLIGAAWLSALRAEHKKIMAQAQSDRRSSAKATKDKRAASLKANWKKRKAEAPSQPLTPFQIARQEATVEKQRIKRNTRMRRYRRKKLANDPDYQHRRLARKMRRYRRRRQQKAKHERWLKKLADAAAKKRTKAERRARREAIAAERAARRAAQGLPPVEKKPTSAERRVQDAFNDGFRQGVEAGRAMERAEKQAA